MPELAVDADGSTPFTVTVTMKVLNTDNFVSFAKAMLYDSEFILHLTGSANLHAAGLDITNLPFDKHLTMAGMSGLTEITINNFDLSNSTDQALTFTLSIVLINPSNVSISLGTIKFDAYQDGNLVGHCQVNSFALVPGVNNLPITGSLDPSQINFVTALLNLYLTGNTVVVTSKVASGGVQSQLFAEALEGYSIIAAIPGLTNGLIKSLTFPAMSIEPTGPDTIFLGVSVNLTINSPLGPYVTLLVKQVAMTMTLQSMSGGLLVQQTVPLTDVNANVKDAQGNPTITLDVAMYLTFTEEMLTNFEEFINSFATQASVEILVVGTADTSIFIGPLGYLNLQGAVVNNPTTIVAMNGLSNNEVISAFYNASSQDEVLMDLVFQVYNPSVATITVGDIIFDIVYDGEILGNMTAANVTFNPTFNTLVLSGIVAPQTASASTAAVALFSAFLLDSSVTVIARASEQALTNIILNAGFQGITIPVSMGGVNGLDQISVSSFDLSRSTDVAIVFAIEAVAVNPSAVTILIGTTFLDAFFGGSLIGHASITDFTLEPGNNNITMVGTLDPANMTAITAMLTPFLSGLPVLVEAEIAINGVASVLLEQALEGWSLGTLIPGQQDALVKNVEMSGMSLTSIDAETLGLNVVVNLTLNNPLGHNVTLDVEQIAVNMTLLSSSGGMMLTQSIPLTTVSADSKDANGDPTLSVTLDMVVSLSGLEQTNFAEFVQQFSTLSTATVIIGGTALAYANVGPLGNLLLAGIQLNQSASLVGMGGLTNTTVTAASFDASSASSVTAALTVTVFNPSAAVVSIGDLSFDIVAGGEVIGSLSASNVTFDLGENTLELSAIINPASGAPTTAAVSLFSTVINEKSATVTAVASANAMVNLALNEGFQGFVLTTALPGLDGLGAVIVNSFTLSGSNSAVDFAMQASVVNPTIVSVNLGTVILDAYYQGGLIGQGSVSNFSLVPGSNPLSLSGTVSSSNLTVVSAMMAPFLSGDLVPVVAQGAQNGAANPVLSGALQTFSLQTLVPGLTTPLIQTIQFESMSLTSINTTAIGIGAIVNLTLNNPLGNNVTLVVNQIAMDLVLLNILGGQMLAATVPLQNAIANAVDANGNPTVTMALNIQASLTSQEQTNFALFIHNFTTQSTASLIVTGTAQTTIYVPPLGTLHLQGVSVNNPSTLTGMGGLASNSVTAASFDASSPSSIALNLTIQVSNPSIATASLGSLTFDIVSNGQIIGNVTAQNVVLGVGTSTLQLTGTINPQNSTEQSAAVSLLTSMVYSSSVAVTAVANPKALVNLALNQGFQGFALTTSLPGLSGLNQVTVSSFDLSKSNDTNVSFMMQGVLVNPSIATVIIGTSYFTASYGGGVIGHAQINNFKLVPGNNAVTMTGLVDPTNMTAVGAMLNPFMAGQVVPVVAKEAVGGVTNTLLYQALLNWSLQTNVPGVTTPLLQSISIVGLSISSINTTSVSLGVTANMTLNSPLGTAVTLLVNQVGMSLNLETISGGVMLQESVPLTPTLGNAVNAAGNPTVTTQFTVIATFTAQQQTNFALFINNFTTMASAQLTISGTATAVVYVKPFGASTNVTITNVPVSNTATVAGMSGLTGSTVTAASFDASSQQHVFTNLTVQIFNPSIASANLGSLTLDVYYAGQMIGTITSTNAVLGLGNNTLQFSGTISPVTAAAGNAVETLFLNYLNTANVTVTTVADPNALVNLALNQGFQNLTLTAFLPGINGLPVVNVTNMQLPQNVKDGTTLGINITVDATLSNPSIASIKLGGIQMQVYYEGTYQGTLSVSQLNLVPGINVFNASGVINPQSGSLVQTGYFFSAYVAGKNSIVILYPDALNPGAAAQWFINTVTNLTLTSQLHTNNFQALSLISGVSMIGQINASLPDTGSPSLGGVAQTTFTNPFAFNITVMSATLNITISDVHNIAIGSVSVPWVTVNSATTGTNKILQLVLNGNLTITNSTAFEQFIQTVLKTTGTTMNMAGVASVKANTGAGIVQIDGVPTSASVAITGYNSFAGGLLAINSISIVGGSAGTLKFNVASTITSTSNVNLFLGSAYFNINYVLNGVFVVIGNASATNVALYGSSAGYANSLTFSGSFFQTGGNVNTAIIDALSNYVDQTSTALTLIGSTVSNPTPLQQALMVTQVNTTLAGVSEPIISSISITGTSSCVMDINNPTSVTITVAAGALSAYVSLPFFFLCPDPVSFC